MVTYSFIVIIIIVILLGLEGPIFADRFCKKKNLKTIKKVPLFFRDKKDKDKSEEISVVALLYQIIQIFLTIVILVFIVLHGVFSTNKILFILCKWAINIYATIIIVVAAVFALLDMRD